MVKHIQTIHQLLPTNCLSVLVHFVGLTLNGLRNRKYILIQKQSVIPQILLGQEYFVPYNLSYSKQLNLKLSELNIWNLYCNIQDYNHLILAKKYCLSVKSPNILLQRNVTYTYNSGQKIFWCYAESQTYLLKLVINWTPIPFRSDESLTTKSISSSCK